MGAGCHEMRVDVTGTGTWLPQSRPGCVELSRPALRPRVGVRQCEHLRLAGREDAGRPHGGGGGGAQLAAGSLSELLSAHASGRRRGRVLAT
jgi:hypothetical protein